MVDVDGVLVVSRGGRRWDADLLADLGIDPSDLQREFFAPHFLDVATGRADLHARLREVLATLAPSVSAETLVRYWHEHDAVLDHRLLDDLAVVRGLGVHVHLATVQTHERAAYLWDDLRLSKRFDAIHHSAAVGAVKPDPSYFGAVLARTGFVAREVVLIDDSADNVVAALSAGWSAVRWRPGERLADALEAALGSGPLSATSSPSGGADRPTPS